MMFIPHYHRVQDLSLLARSVLRHQVVMFMQGHMKVPEIVADL